MAKGQAWCQKHRDQIGLFEQEAMMTDLVSDAVVAVLVPGAKEEALIDLYGDAYRMDQIGVANEAALSMTGRGYRVGPGWWCATGAITGVGALALAAGHRIAGGAMLGAGIMAGAVLGGLALRGRLAKWHTTTWRLG
jgi:hypothetical protein